MVDKHLLSKIKLGCSLHSVVQAAMVHHRPKTRWEVVVDSHTEWHLREAIYLVLPPPQVELVFILEAHNLEPQVQLSNLASSNSALYLSLAVLVAVPHPFLEQEELV
jgi:hypothetical protein